MYRKCGGSRSVPDPVSAAVRRVESEKKGSVVHVVSAMISMLATLASAVIILSLSLSLRDIMNRSDSDSALPLSHGESRGLYGSKPFLLSSRLHPLQGQGSWVGGGSLEKSSSLGELSGSSAAVLASSCSTRSLCVTSDAVDSPLVFASSASSSSSGNGRGTAIQLPARRSPTEEDGGEESESSGSRRRNAFNKIFKKKQGRHWTSQTCDEIWTFIMMSKRSQEHQF